MQISVLLILSYFTITNKITFNFGELLLFNKISQKPQIDRIFSRVLRDSTPRFVRWFVGPSVRPSLRHTLLFFAVSGLTALAQMRK